MSSSRWVQMQKKKERKVQSRDASPWRLLETVWLGSTSAESTSNTTTLHQDRSGGFAMRTLMSLRLRRPSHVESSIHSTIFTRDSAFIPIFPIFYYDQNRSTTGKSPEKIEEVLDHKPCAVEGNRAIYPLVYRSRQLAKRGVWRDTWRRWQGTKLGAPSPYRRHHIRLISTPESGLKAS